MRFQSSKLASAGLAACLAASLLPLGVAGQQPVSSDSPFRRVSDKLLCQCGCNYGLSFCPHLQCPSAPKLRAAIQEKLSSGMSEQQVLDAMVADFGLAVLAAPPKEGFNWTAWVMPFAALLIGLLGVQQIIRRWRRKSSVQPATDPALVERYRKSIEREMKHLEE